MTLKRQLDVRAARAHDLFLGNDSSLFKRHKKSIARTLNDYAVVFDDYAVVIDVFALDKARKEGKSLNDIHHVLSAHVHGYGQLVIVGQHTAKLVYCFCGNDISKMERVAVVVYSAELKLLLALGKAEAVAGDAKKVAVVYLEISTVEYNALVVDAHGVADLVYHLAQHARGKGEAQLGAQCGKRRKIRRRQCAHAVIRLAAHDGYRQAVVDRQRYLVSRHDLDRLQKLLRVYNATSALKDVRLHGGAHAFFQVVGGHGDGGRSLRLKKDALHGGDGRSRSRCRAHERRHAIYYFLPIKYNFHTIPLFFILG